MLGRTRARRRARPAAAALLHQQRAWRVRGLMWETWSDMTQHVSAGPAPVKVPLPVRSCCCHGTRAFPSWAQSAHAMALPKVRYDAKLCLLALSGYKL